METQLIKIWNTVLQQGWIIRVPCLWHPRECRAPGHYLCSYLMELKLLENIQHPVHLVHNVGQAHDGVRELRTKWPFAKLLCFFFHPLCCVWLVDFLLHCTDAVCSLNCVHIAQATRCYYYTYHLSAGTFGVVLLLRISCACKH